MQNYCDIIIISPAAGDLVSCALRCCSSQAECDDILWQVIRWYCFRSHQPLSAPAIYAFTLALTYLIRNHLTGSIELIILIRIEIFIKWLTGMALLPAD